MSAVLVISGGRSSTSTTEKVAEHVLRHVVARGHTAEHLRVRELPARALVAGDPADPAIGRAIEEVAAADGIVLATPIYQAAYSGLLKAFLDLLPQFALSGKSVLPLATGGSLAHVLALDYALRPVIQSLAAGHVVRSTFVLGGHVVTSKDGVTVDDHTAGLLRDAVDDFEWSLSARRQPTTVAHST